METTYIEHNGKQYEVKEPTIKTWKNVMIFKDLLDEEEMSVKMISEVTGLSVKEVKEADALEIRIAGDKLWRYLNQESKQLHRTIEHNGTTYDLVDVNKISFGQFVDIDTFMKKDDSYKIANLNELAAYLYCEQGIKYGDSDIKKRIEEFKDLRVKYIESAVFFFVEFGKGIARAYPALFQEQDDVVDNENENSFGKFWGWYAAIAFLAENKVWQVDSVTNLSLMACLNHLSYLVDVNNEKEKLNKQQQPIS